MVDCSQNCLVMRWLGKLLHPLRTRLSHSLHVALGSSSTSIPLKWVMLVLLLVLLLPRKRSLVDTVPFPGCCYISAQTTSELDPTNVVEWHVYELCYVSWVGVSMSICIHCLRWMIPCCFQILVKCLDWWILCVTLIFTIIFCDRGRTPRCLW